MPIVLTIVVVFLVLFLLALVGFCHIMSLLLGGGKTEHGSNVSVEVLHEANRKVRELEAAVGEGKARIKALEDEARSRTTEVPPGEESGKSGLALPPNGREVFLPLLDPNRVYEITVQGQFRERDAKSRGEKSVARADALYRTDALGNFVVPHMFLMIGGAAARDFLANDDGVGISAEDREAHRYRFRIDGEEKNRALSFCVSLAGLRDAPEGFLAMTVECLPPGVLSPAAARRKDAKAKADAAREDAKRARLATTLAELRLRAHHEAHFSDPEFQTHFAQHETKTLLEAQRPEWAREYGEFMHDADLRKLVEAEAPDVLAWFDARVKIVQLAERFAVAPPPAPKVEPPKPRKNAEQVRAMKLRREAVQTDDQIALAKQKAEKLLKAKEELGAVPLEPEERERIETELTENILDSQEKKNGEAATTL